MVRTFSLQGIQGRLFLLIVIVLIPLLLLEAIMYYARFEGRKTEELQANLELARAFAKHFETFLQGLLRNELAVGLSLAGSRPMTEPGRNRLLDRFQAGTPGIHSVFWLDPSGVVTGSSLRSSIGLNLNELSFFKKVKGGSDWAVSELIVGRATGKPAFSVSRGIRNEKGGLLGLVVASVEPDRLDSILGIERAKDAGLSLIDDKGMHVYRYPATEYTWEQRNWLKIYPEMENSLKGKEVLTSVTSGLTGKKRLVAFTPIPSVGWVAAASRAEKEVITSMVLLQAGLILFLTLVGFAAAIALSRSISNSIIRLRDHALALGRGEVGNKAPSSGPGEVKELATAFDQMVQEVTSREAALRESEKRYRQLSDENARLLEQAQQDAQTKTILLHEVNHRVKNNLSSIIGLIRTEERFRKGEGSPEFRSMCSDLASRVQGLATVHKLLSAAGWSSVKLTDIATEVIHSTLQILPSDQRVSVQVSPTSIPVTPDQASTLALVINELATNTIKHGQRGKQASSISVRIEENDDQIVFEFRDNGPGYPEPILAEKHYNVGLDLVTNLVLRDLRGEVTLCNDDGAVTRIQFGHRNREGGEDR